MIALATHLLLLFTAALILCWQNQVTPTACGAANGTLPPPLKILSSNGLEPSRIATARPLLAAGPGFPPFTASTTKPGRPSRCLTPPPFSTGVFIDRFPFALKHTLENARRILPLQQNTATRNLCSSVPIRGQRFFSPRYLSATSRRRIPAVFASACSSPHRLASFVRFFHSSLGFGRTEPFPSNGFGRTILGTPSSSSASSAFATVPSAPVHTHSLVPVFRLGFVRTGLPTPKWLRSYSPRFRGIVRTRRLNARPSGSLVQRPPRLFVRTRGLNARPSGSVVRRRPYPPSRSSRPSR